MYNKLFAKILDSSIWLESVPTRIVWLTFIAVMDEHGFAQFAAPGNLANRARVTLEDAEEAIRILESPDENSSNPDHDGRRIERVPGGWMILNADKHRDMVTRAVVQSQTRERVRRHRERKREGNADVTQANEKLTLSDTETEVETAVEKDNKPTHTAAGCLVFGTEVHQTAYLAMRQAARRPESFDALLGTLHEPVSGGTAYEWPVIGQALLELHTAGGAVTPQAIRAFCRKLVEPERPHRSAPGEIDWKRPTREVE